MKIFFIALILISVTISAQEKYLIYFKDKGEDAVERLIKIKSGSSFAEEILSPRAIERRKKTLGEDFFSFNDLPVNKNYVDQLKEKGIKIVHELSWFNSVSAYLTLQQKNEIASLPFIQKIEKVKTIKFKKRFEELSKPSASAFDTSQYGPSFPQNDLSGIPQAHNKGISGTGALIGFLDSGFDWKNHESLKDLNVIGEYDFIFQDSVTANEAEDRADQHDHGTYVFSIAAGYKEGEIIGPAYNASFLLAKTEYIPTETHAEEDNYAAALIWMENLGVDITSSSLGYNEFDDGGSYTYQDMNGNTTIVTKALNNAFNLGVVTITAAGNEGAGAWKYIIAPADAFNVLAVGAVTNSNQVAGFSSRGPTPDGRIKPEVVAQGVSVYGAWPPGGGYRHANGTSSATPITAGVAGMLLSANPHLNNTQVRNIFLENGDNASSPDNDRGYGLVSAVKILSYPNLEKLPDGKLKVHKIFFDNNINTSTAKLFYSFDNSAFTEAVMEYDGSLKYNFTFPELNPNQTIRFYFTYNNSSGNLVREPVQLNRIYSLNSSELNISLIPLPHDYGILSQNYPNPFNNTTTIAFKADGAADAEIVIYNWLGEKVRTLFNGKTNPGENFIEWDGRDNNNKTAASGVYFYVLKLAGREFAKKMIFLK